MRANNSKICRIVAILARTDILTHDTLQRKFTEMFLISQYFTLYIIYKRQFFTNPLVTVLKPLYPLFYPFKWTVF